MPDPQTSNLQLYIPLNGADVGTWDVPVNANMQTLDSALGGTATLVLTNVPVVLSPAQYSCGTIICTGVQTGDVLLTFPNYGRIYNIINLCTNNTTWIVKLQTAALGNIICAPPGEMVSTYTDGTSFSYVNLGHHIGEYWDHGGTTVPRWVSGCTTPPYLNCDGSAFNAATYPALAAYLGGATVPDARGRFRGTLNQGTGRMTFKINGNVLAAAGGLETIAVADLPNWSLIVSDPGHFHNILDLIVSTGLVDPGVVNPVVTGVAYNGVGASTTGNHLTGIGVTSGGANAGYLPPGYIGGLTLIRAG